MTLTIGLDDWLPIEHIPPVDAVIQVMLKRQVADLKLKVTDAAGAMIRELPVAGAKNQAGIQTICWDQDRKSVV